MRGSSAAVAVPVWRVRVIIPCFNRQRDLDLLLGDLAALHLGSPGRAELGVLVVDNASDPPLDLAQAPLRVEVLRQSVNTGGSGGYNAGMARVLSRGTPGDRSELLWLLDSDVRIASGALLPLLEAIGSDPTVMAAGSVLADPDTERVYEVGGRINRATGEYEQPIPPGWEQGGPVEAEYLAACSLLVRRSAVEKAGLMADLFLNGDDVEWSLRLTQRNGGRLVVAPGSRATHPNPDRMRTGARYYAARNAFVALGAAGAGRRATFVRALRETGRAMSQHLVGRSDLAELHMRGLRDAAQGIGGPAPEGTIAFEPWRPMAELPGVLRRVLADAKPHGRVMIRKGVLSDMSAVAKALNAACVEPIIKDSDQPSFLSAALAVLGRAIAGSPFGVALVSARARPADWLVGRVIVTVAPEGFVVDRIHPLGAAVRAAATAARGLWLATRLALRRRPMERHPATPLGVSRPTVSIVVLSHNRWAALERTLEELALNPDLAGAQVIVADNASTDGTKERIGSRFPRVEFLPLQENRGVEGFNEGVRRASGDLVLILDDDSWPGTGVVERAVGLLARDPDLGAVALHPRHPETGVSEWGFAGEAPRRDWPVMGCGNLVRRDVWERIGGYEPGFFLYRNDTDLAMKVLEAGYGVAFDPSWVVWHASPAAATKSVRWCDLATRNWVWVCRRHGKGAARLVMIGLGWIWAHRLAGLSVARHAAVLKGLHEGIRRAPPPLPHGLRVDGRPLRTLLQLRMTGARNSPSMPRHSP